MSQKNSEPVELTNKMQILRLELRIASINEELGEVYKKELLEVLYRSSRAVEYSNLHIVLTEELNKLRTELLLIQN